MKNFNNMNNFLLKEDKSENRIQNDSTSCSLNDENKRNENNNNFNYKLNINQKILNINQINMEMQNIDEDIFPKERLGGNLNYINNDLNSYSTIQIKNKFNALPLETTLDKNKQIIFKEDIPEMLLYKYNYDVSLYKESLKEIEYETNWLYDFLNVDKTIQGNEEKKEEIINTIKNLLTEYKEQKYDIPYIIANRKNLYDKYFTQSQVLNLLSVHDVEFLRLQKKRKKIINIYNYIIKDEESTLSKNISNYFKKEYIYEAKNESELDLIEAQLGILTYVYQSVDIDENYKKLINYDSLSNSNIDFSILNKIKDHKLNDILKKFCLSPEQVVHNLKVINGEIDDELIEPPNCSLGEVCREKISQMSGKYNNPSEVLKISLEYYILLLSSHPYIFRLINKELFSISTLSTSPTDKGKEILNSLHPSYHTKRINNIPISSFFEEKNQNICNIYTNELGDLYLDIEKCVSNGLIKCDINTQVNTLENSRKIEDIINVLTKAINAIKNGDNSNEEEQKVTNPNKIKNNGARKVAMRNMILFKNYSQGFFLNYIKKELHNYSEKYIIKKISSEFSNLISRNYLDKIKIENDSFIVSITYNNQKQYFKCLCIYSNYRIIQSKKLEYLWRNDKISEASITATINLSKEVCEFKRIIVEYNPIAIIIDVSNLECYKMINYIRSRFKDSNFVCSDYISKINELKIIEINEEQENKRAIDQVKYIVNPVNQIIELWNYKYDQNLLLNLTLHPQQVNIKDIPFFNYSLESQLINVINAKGIYLSDLPKYSYNLFNFISGFGPCSSSFIINNINNPFAIKSSLIKTNPTLYHNISPFIIEYEDNTNNTRNLVYKFSLVKLDVFNSMRKDSIYFKKNCLCNAIVCDVDTKEKVVNCILLRDCNSIRAILKFSNIDINITNYPKFFYPQRIILVKIKDIILRHHSYEIQLSNKNEDLISVKDFFEEEKKSKIFDRFTIDEEEDFTIKDIKRLKEIQEYDQGKNNKSLKYLEINMENEQILINANYINTKMFFECYRNADYRIRPSFLGENHLILTFPLMEDIYLNYDIEIKKIEVDNYNEENEKSYITNYVLKNVYYKSLNELVDIFATKMTKKIKEFKKSEYFRYPSEIRNLFYQIFSIKNNNKNKNIKDSNKMDIEYEGNDIVKMNDTVNDIILGFLKESPEYGILFTKSSHDYNYCIDFIKILYNGYLFHGKIFNSLYDLINFYKDVHKTVHYQNFIKRQFICNIHSQIEEIDEKYTEFEGPDPNLEKYKYHERQTIEMKELKDNLMGDNTKENNSYLINNEFIGKKRKTDSNLDGMDMNPNSNLENNNYGTNNDTNNNVNENDLWETDNKFDNNNNRNNKTFGDNNKNNYKGKKKFDGNKKQWNNKNKNNNISDNWNNSNNNIDNWNNSNNNNDNWNSSNKNNGDNWNNSNNNNNDDWINSNNDSNDNRNNKNNKKVWGKSGNNNDSNNENNAWGSSDNSNDMWNMEQNSNIKTEKNEPIIKNEIDAWGTSNSGGNWDNSNNVDIQNNQNENEDWVEPNNKNNTNKDNNKRSYSKTNNRNERSNKSKNNVGAFNRKNGKTNNNFGKFNKDKKNNQTSNFSWGNTSNNEDNKTSNNKGINEDNWGSSDNNEGNKDEWGSTSNKNNYKDNWDNKNNNNDSWGNPEKKNDEWNKQDKNNGIWGNPEKKVDDWNKQDANNDSWGNTEKKNDNWGSNNNNDTNWDSQKNINNNWETSNKSKDNLGISNKNSSWETSNTSNNNWDNSNANNDNWGKANDKDNWDNSNTNNDGWGKTNNKDSWGNSNNNNDNWDNQKNNDNWASSDNNNNNRNSFNKQNNNKFNKKNDFRKNNNYNNNFNKNNNKSWDKTKENKNNTKANSTGWSKPSNNKDNNKYNKHSNNNWDNKNDEWGNSNNKNVNNNKNKKKITWAEELKNGYDGSNEIKQEGEISVKFEGENKFGGYNY